jgi:hypothetical protein
MKPTLLDRVAQTWRALFRRCVVGESPRSGQRVPFHAEATEGRPARWVITPFNRLSEQEAQRLENSKWLRLNK